MTEELAAAILLGFELANEHAKQLITLSTGVIAISVTFLNERRDLLGRWSRWLAATWMLHLAAIICGICAMSALTGQLIPMHAASKAPETIGGSARLFAFVQLLTFFGGMVAFTVFGIGTMRHAAESVVERDRLRPSPVRAFFSALRPSLRSIRDIPIFGQPVSAAVAVATAPAAATSSDIAPPVAAPGMPGTGDTL